MHSNGHLRRNLLQTALAFALGVISSSAGADWWNTYHTVATDPKQMNVSTVGPMAVRSAGYYGGWYGFWYWENQEYVSSYARNTWANMDAAGAKRIFYFDDGEYGDFASFFDSEGEMIHNAWTISFWNGTPPIAAAHWFGLENFMADVPWAPYPTASDHGLPPFTHPDGSALGTADLYDVLARKAVDGGLNISYAYNGNVSDQEAQDSGLDEISFKSGTSWCTGRLWSLDTANPQMTSYRIAELERMMGLLEDPKGTHIDNYGANNLWSPRNGAFGDWSVYRFKEYLNANFTSQELTALGISDPATFDMCDYVLNKGIAYSSPTWADDTLWNVYKVYKAKEGLRHARAIYEAAHAKADELALDFAVCGNVIPLWPGAALMRNAVDITSFEWLVEGTYPGFSDPGLPPDLRAGYITRLGARMNTAPYCWPELYVLYNPADPDNNTGFLFGSGHENFHKVMAFDCFANRGILDHAYWFQNKRSVGTDESAAYVNAFIEALPPDLSDREYLADIGLVFNPWCDVAASTVAGMQNDVFLDEYSGWADFLSLGHYQWEVLLAEELTEVDLADFPILILPSVSVVDAEMHAALDDYLDEGGRLVTTGETGEKYGADAYFAPRESPLFTPHESIHATSEKPGQDYRLNGRPGDAFDAMAALVAFDGIQPSVQTDAPESVGVNLNMDRTGPAALRFTLDLNNYDVNRETDVLTPVPPVEAAINLPEPFRFDPSATVNFVAANAEGPLLYGTLSGAELVYGAGDSTATLQIPGFDYYLMAGLEGLVSGTVEVPDFSGLSREQAEDALWENYLGLGQVTYEFSPIADPGKVIGQSYPAGTSLDAGSSIDIVIATEAQLPAATSVLLSAAVAAVGLGIAGSLRRGRTRDS